jgi:DASS family divalent anion:Na+ symporter
MWISSDVIGISIMETTLTGLCVFLIFGILDIKEILSSNSTFNAVIMLGLLISYVNCMQTLGVIDWFNTIISGSLSGISPTFAFFFLSVIYFLSHYFFTGEGAKIIALYAPFFATGVALGIAPTIVAMTLAFFSSASDVLAQHTCLVSIVISRAGYVSVKKWMAIGLVVATIIITVWHAYLRLYC